MNSSIVNKFSIIGLFGKKNIEIDMSRACCILIGENGLGKTTILSIINNILSCQFQKLTGYNFIQIEIVIADISFSFTKEEIDSFAMAYSYHSEDMDMSILSDLIKALKDLDLELLSNEIFSEMIEDVHSYVEELGT